jgi:hypothetical protein
MPRYDDRLSNVLDLLNSGDQNNSDTVFRHISDILLQESAWMDADRRAVLVGHLVDIYPKTTQPARMEVMDIAAQVSDAPPELVKIAASDSTLVGTRLWDRVRLPSESWHALLPDLPKPILGRLRARLDLPDDVVVAIDRAWRERLKTPGFTAPTLYEALTALIAPQSRPAQDVPGAAEPPDEEGPHNFEDDFEDDFEDHLEDQEDILELEPAPIENADETQTPVVDAGPAQDDTAAVTQDSPKTRPQGGDTPRQNIFERAFEESLDRGDAAFFEDTPRASDTQDVQTPAGEITPKEDDSAPADTPLEPGSLLFVPSAEDEHTEAADADAPQEEAEAIDLTSILNPNNEDQNTRTIQQDDVAEATPDFADAQIIDFPQENDEQTTEQENTADEDELLSDKPQVEDPKIQDILARLREFDSRSKRLALDAADESTVSADQGPETFEDPPKTAASLFLADQPEDSSAEPPADEDIPDDPREEETAAQEAVFSAETQARFQPVTVHGATWVTDRFGSLVECTGGPGAAFGAAPEGAQGGAQEGAEGLILSSLFVGRDQKTLDAALHARSAFRDMRLTAATDKTIWMLSAVPIFDEDSGIFLGHRGTARSITLDMKDDTQDTPALQPQLAQEAPLDMASLAHELKTPLNAIRGFAEMIETEQLGPASAFARDRSQKIGQEADQLHQVLNDLLLPKIAQSQVSDGTTAVHNLLETALARFTPHLTIEGLSTLSLSLTTTMQPAFLTSLVEKILHASALWTPAHSTVHVTFSQEGPSTVNMAAALPAWAGAQGGAALSSIQAGPRLSYRHPLEANTFQGRGVSAIIGDIQAAGARVFARHPGRQNAALVLAIPVKDTAQ